MSDVFIIRLQKFSKLSVSRCTEYSLLYLRKSKIAILVQLKKLDAGSSPEDALA